MSRRILSMIFILCLLPLRPSHAEIVDRIVAIVNDEIITQRELEEKAYPILLSMPGDPSEEEISQIKKNVSIELVKNKLVIQAAKQKKILLDREEVEAFVRARTQALEKQYGEDLDNVLAEQGYTVGDFEELMRREAKQEILKSRLIAQAVEGAVVVTDDDIRTEYSARMLVARSPDLAFQALLNLKSGKLTFANAVRQYSAGAGAEENGDMGSFLIGKWSEEIEAEIIKLKSVGDLSGVIQTAAGFVVVQLVDRRRVAIDTVSAENRKKIRERLVRLKSASESGAYVSSLWDRAYVKFID
ncbi:MAG: hypothetical protein A3G34_07675 [Candidatus Lindowbacteria bacterium RIFCSPLOWO2_12_FULL_62_27]|nr:MAG: hypothetical protein A3G34_07675 [Candidatus Lindowbacteria bacterium RIFCSPLOWO2_12_FULL_62_27]OGH63561.1 MAG: hypothetical protein A3I06_06915 [Candidatus Lindowbacteria bacterium RIFCSPLOWO2_02_FULL_62_12]